VLHGAKVSESTEALSSAEVPLLELIDRNELGGALQRTARDPSAVVGLLKDAGFAGVVAYFVAFVCFYGVALPTGYLGYHAATGVWMNPSLLLQADGAEGRAETLALCISYYFLLKPLAPVRLGGAIFLTPKAKRFIAARPAVEQSLAAIGTFIEPFYAGVGAISASVSRVIAPRQSAKAELLELARRDRARAAPSEPADRARFDFILTELANMNPTPDPARSSLLSGEWECAWNTEVKRNLFGSQRQRTYQTIDIAAETLENVVVFNESGDCLRVSSRIDPDAALSTRYNCSYERCSVGWRGSALQLPLVGRDWREIMYLDDDTLIQRDARGDLVVSTRVQNS
jgi:hypothetical protein